MEAPENREKLNIVWGCVFLTSVAALFLLGFVSSGGLTVDRPEPILGALLGAVLMSGVLVPLLLTVSGNGPTLLAGGRILLWVQAAGLLTAGILTLVELG